MLRFNTRKVSGFACIATLAAGLAAPVAAQTFTAGTVMERMSADERVSFWMGIIEGLAHARYVRDNKDTAGRACIYNWMRESNSNQKLREAFLKYPNAMPGQIVGILVAVKCGE